MMRKALGAGFRYPVADNAAHSASTTRAFGFLSWHVGWVIGRFRDRRIHKKRFGCAHVFLSGALEYVLIPYVPARPRHGTGRTERHHSSQRFVQSPVTNAAEDIANGHRRRPRFGRHSSRRGGPWFHQRVDRGGYPSQEVDPGDAGGASQRERCKYVQRCAQGGGSRGAQGHAANC